MRRGNLFIAGACTVLLCLACSPEIDKNRFQNANRIAESVQSTIANGVNYQQFDRLLQRLSAEIAVLNDTSKSERDREVIKAYSELLRMYQDGFLLWKYHTEFSGHNFVPGARIYVGQDVEPIVTKYRLQTESHIFGPTQQSWKSISEDSIQVIWYNAGQQLKRIHTLFDG